MAAARPEVILLPDEPDRSKCVRARDFAPHAAVRDGRIRLVDGKLLFWHGPCIGEALRVVPSPLARGAWDAGPSREP